MSNDSDPLVSIRDMVQRSGVASSTLRYYEKLGLIASEREGSSESEHRRYHERIDQRIAELKQLKIDIVNCTCGRTKASARGR